MTSLADITVTVRLTTRCGSRLTCDNLTDKTSCEECLRAEVEKKLGDDAHLPHFTVDRTYITMKPLQLLPAEKHRDVTVQFTVPRPGEVFGPYFKIGARGRMITRERALELVDEETLARKIERAHQAALDRRII